MPTDQPRCRFIKIQPLLTTLYSNPFAKIDDFISILRYHWSSEEMADLILNASSLGRRDKNESARGEITANLIDHALNFMNRKAILKDYFKRVSKFGLERSPRPEGAAQRLQLCVDGLAHLKSLVPNKERSLTILQDSEMLARFIEGCPRDMKLTQAMVVTFVEQSNGVGGALLTQNGIAQALGAAFLRCPKDVAPRFCPTDEPMFGSDLRRLRNDQARASAAYHYIDIARWLRQQSGVSDPHVALKEAMQLFSRASSSQGALERLKFLSSSGWLPSVNEPMAPILEASFQRLQKPHLAAAAMRFKNA